MRGAISANWCFSLPLPQVHEMSSWDKWSFTFQLNCYNFELCTPKSTAFDYTLVRLFALWFQEYWAENLRAKSYPKLSLWFPLFFWSYIAPSLLACFSVIFWWKYSRKLLLVDFITSWEYIRFTELGQVSVAIVLILTMRKIFYISKCLWIATYTLIRHVRW